MLDGRLDSKRSQDQLLSYLPAEHRQEQERRQPLRTNPFLPSSPFHHLFSAADSFAPSHLPPPSTMDRSTQELFLNFMIVLITVLLMWLLVKTYQD
ncbi:unnamed protein product [Menidia menidia]|nr:unnamed protein product [Menidia menidia]